MNINNSINFIKTHGNAMEKALLSAILKDKYNMCIESI